MFATISSRFKARTCVKVVSNVVNRNFARARPIVPSVKKLVQVQKPIERKVTAPAKTSPVSATQTVTLSDDSLPKDDQVTVKTKLGLVEKRKDGGYGKITMKNGNVYIGELLQNRQHGYGVLTSPTGASFEGMWVEGLKHGQGKTIFPNGTVLEGEFEDDVLLPHTARTTFVGTLEVGTWVTGNGEGQCELQNNDGSVLKGEFKEGKIYNGSGVAKFVNGTVLDGTWVKGCMEGQGKILIPNDRTYEGSLRRGRMHGRGTLTKADGSAYEGDFVDDQYEGFGKRVTASGWNYEGGWLDHMYHGLGRLKCPKGVAEGEFRKGQLCNGEGTIMTKDGIVYKGKWREFLIYGKATLVDGTKQSIYGIRLEHFVASLKPK